MTDVQLLDVKVPIEFYKALNPIRAATSEFAEARITLRMRDALDVFLREVAKAAYQDSGLKTRSGNLKRSLIDEGPKVFGDYTVNSVRGYFVVPDYVAAQSDGAHITPKKARVLCVPLPSALRADGTPKRRYPALWKPMGTFSYQSKRTGKGYLAYRDPGGNLVLLYVYVDAVTLPARLKINAHYRDMLPLLMGMWENILASEIVIAYGRFTSVIGKMVE